MQGEGSGAAKLTKHVRPAFSIRCESLARSSKRIVSSRWLYLSTVFLDLSCCTCTCGTRQRSAASLQCFIICYSGTP